MSMQVIALNCDKEFNDIAPMIDYSQLFRNAWSPCGMRKLSVSCASGFLDTLELFARGCQGLWTMNLMSSISHRLTLHAGETQWSILFHDSISLGVKRGFSAHLQRLSQLDLWHSDFAKLHNIPAGSWDRALPCLRTLTLIVPARHYQMIAPSISGDLASIHMPALEVLTLRLRDHEQLEVTALLPSLFLRGRDATPLARIHVAVDDWSQCSVRTWFRS